jgi:hypothetical protein
MPGHFARNGSTADKAAKLIASRATLEETSPVWTAPPLAGQYAGLTAGHGTATI